MIGAGVPEKMRSHSGRGIVWSVPLSRGKSRNGDCNYGERVFRQLVVVGHRFNGRSFSFLWRDKTGAAHKRANQGNVFVSTGNADIRHVPSLLETLLQENSVHFCPLTDRVVGGT